MLIHDKECIEDKRICVFFEERSKDGSKKNVYNADS